MKSIKDEINDAPTIFKLLNDPNSKSYDSLLWSINKEIEINGLPITHCRDKCLEIRIDSVGTVFVDENRTSPANVNLKIEEFFKHSEIVLDPKYMLQYPDIRFQIWVHVKKVRSSQEVFSQICNYWNKTMELHNSENDLRLAKDAFFKLEANPIRPRVFTFIQTWNDGEIIDIEVEDLDAELGFK